MKQSEPIKILTLRLPWSLSQAIEAQAADQGISVTQCIVDALKKQIKEVEGK